MRKKESEKERQTDRKQKSWANNLNAIVELVDHHDVKTLVLADHGKLVR